MWLIYVSFCLRFFFVWTSSNIRFAFLIRYLQKKKMQNASIKYYNAGLKFYFATLIGIRAEHVLNCKVSQPGAIGPSKVPRDLTRGTLVQNLYTIINNP